MLTSTQRRLLLRALVLLAGTGLGIALLIYLLRSVNLDQLGTDFSRVDARYLLLAIPPFLVNLLVKVPRWGLLYGEEAPGWDTLFGAMNVGYAVNSLLPARLGEIVRAYWIRDHSGIGMVRTLSTIALERVTDGITLIVLLLVVAPTVAFPGKLLASALTIGALFAIVLVGMVALAYGSTHRNTRLSTWLERLERGRTVIFVRAIRQLIAGLQVLRSRRAVGLLLLYTGIIWASNTVLIWLVLRAFHIVVPITSGILLSSVLNLGMAVPSSPGYLGVFDGLMVVTLGLYGVQRTPALAAAFAFHAIAFVPVTLIGLAYIVRGGVHLTLQMMRGDAKGNTRKGVVGNAGQPHEPQV